MLLDDTESSLFSLRGRDGRRVSFLFCESDLVSTLMNLNEELFEEYLGRKVDGMALGLWLVSLQ